MTVHEVTPAIDPNTLLAGAQFVDAFRIETRRPARWMRGTRRNG